MKKILNELFNGEPGFRNDFWNGACAGMCAILAQEQLRTGQYVLAVLTIALMFLTTTLAYRSHKETRNFINSFMSKFTSTTHEKD